MGLNALEKKRFENLAQQLHIEFVEQSQRVNYGFYKLDRTRVLHQTIDFPQGIEDLEPKEYETPDGQYILRIKFVKKSPWIHVEYYMREKRSVLEGTIDFAQDIEDLESEEYETADGLNILPIRVRKQYTRRAKKIASKAMKLKLERSKASTSTAPKESTWRFKTEIPIFESLEVTITCKTCSKRLWKSLFESPFPPDDGDLERRQNRREYCTCTEEDRSDDYCLDHTMEVIIKDSIEPRIIHPPLLRDAIGKDLEPDYVAGLQKHRFNQDMENPLIKDQLQDQPVIGDDMVFPFMVAEAKKEDGDSWDYTNFQTVFPIYTMLSVQWRLLSANTANGHLLDFDPIVWFYAYRGQQWKLHLAYLDKNCIPTRNFQVLEGEVAIPDNILTSKQIPYPIKIARVWEGDLTDENKALQLLLIVDHMADWARDYYREMIKEGLQNLNEGSSLEAESIDSPKTDILSRINSRTSDTSKDSNGRKLGKGKDEIRCSANDLISASIPGYRSCYFLSDDQPKPPLTGVSSPLNEFPCSKNIQMLQQLRLEQRFDELFPNWPYQGKTHSLSEPQTPIYDAGQAFSNMHLWSGIPYAEPSQVAQEPLPLPTINNQYLSAGNPYLGVPHSAHQLQQSQSNNNVFLPGSSLLPIAPQIVQQPQPLYVPHEFPSVGNQCFRASQAVQQSQPEMYPTTGRQLNHPGRVGPIRTPSWRSKWDDSERTRSKSPKMRHTARQSRE